MTFLLGAEGVASQDTHYLNAQDKSSIYSAGIGVAGLGFALGSVRQQSAGRSFGDTPGMGASPRVDGLYAGIGRLFWQYDPEGFFFTGNALGGFVAWSSAGASRRPASVWQVAAFAHGPLRTPEEAVREKDWTPDDSGLVLWGATADYQAAWGGFSFAYASMHLPERAAQSGVNIGSVPVIQGQAGRDALRVIYGGGRFVFETTRLHTTAAVWMNSGTSFAVNPLGWKNANTQKDIHGTLAYAALDYDGGRLGSPSSASPCSREAGPRICVALRPEKYQSSVGAALLYTTRDESASDRHSRAFNSPAATPEVAGGAASILLSGPVPLQIQGPFDHDRQTPAREYPMRGEADRPGPNPAPFDFGNQGLQMFSLRGGLWADLVHLDLWANYADLGTARGREVVASVRLPAGAELESKTEWEILAALTGAWVKPDHREYDEWTGLSKPPRTRFYARYLLGVTLRL
ncbi:MAG: hypothetical protein HY042_08635 [Spirochaetia bacterium]|nr:hypothetical protein [Spirochaetia bacterium]